MTKEEIKPIIILNNVYGESRKTTDVYYPVTVILKAMIKFAELKTDQQTSEKNSEIERLMAELSEKDAEIEMLLYSHAKLQSELNELKERHKKDVITFIKWIGLKFIKQSWFKHDKNGWYIPETCKYLSSEEFVNLYYKQKFENDSL